MNTYNQIKVIIRLLTLVTVFLLVNHTQPSAQTESEQQNPEQFLLSLEGEWIGKAEITPIGPVNYDITFKRTKKTQVEGAVKLKAATHYWTFYEDKNQLKLLFLTTFRGNTKPIDLEVCEWDKDGVLFQAKKPELLSLRVMSSADQLSIDIFHWDKLHVSIRLNKFNNHYSIF